LKDKIKWIEKNNEKRENGKIKARKRNIWKMWKNKRENVKNGEKKNTKENNGRKKIKSTKLWKNNNEKKIKIEKETNKYALCGKNYWKGNKYSPRETNIYKRNEK
jgi:hypothetical protein